MSSLNYLVPQRKREHPNRKKSKAKAARCAQAAHGYKAPSKKAQRGQNHNARQGHNRAKKAGKGGAPKQ
ncbi:hypothetical protein COHA_008000 [Chlorella ohadii]|uniref:Uncharacterized protein n=1 Tax=Chlorella ohadii TaxID=2649997 RepID=A0AAD5GZA4_9CHLO|nr:hypothetical protein COHA_008000 [Chlorella ohadii]